LKLLADVPVSCFDIAPGSPWNDREVVLHAADAGQSARRCFCLTNLIDLLMQVGICAAWVAAVRLATVSSALDWGPPDWQPLWGHDINYLAATIQESSRHLQAIQSAIL